MPALSILIKPASSLCDLRCKYCFYADVADHRDIRNYGIMNESTTEALISRAFECADPEVTFAFQGGEPTLAGLNYFRHFVSRTKELNTKNIQVNFALQTNGMSITEEMAAFFAENRFLLGVSLDGPKDIHDMNRVGPSGMGSYKTIKQHIRLLEKHKVDFNILTVVNRAVAKHPKKIYQYLVKEGYRYLQFIPCLDDFGEPHGSSAYALTPKDYGQFLCTLFDHWYRDFKTGKRISIRMFDNILHILLGMPPESCDMVGLCSANTVIEADGSVYPCDFYVLDQWKLGMIQDTPLMEMITGDTARDFIEISKPRHEKCQSCDYLPVCRSGCRRHKTQDAVSEIGLNYFCPSYEAFYAYTLPRFQEVANVLYREMGRQKL